MSVHPDAADEAIDDFRKERRAERIESRLARGLQIAALAVIAWAAFSIAGAINILAGIVQSKEITWQAPSPASPSTSAPIPSGR